MDQSLYIKRESKNFYFLDKIKIQKTQWIEPYKCFICKRKFLCPLCDSERTKMRPKHKTHAYYGRVWLEQGIKGETHNCNKCHKVTEDEINMKLMKKLLNED